MQQSAFTGSRRRDDGNHLSLPQTQVRIGQNRQAFLAAAVNFLQASRFHHDGSCASVTRSVVRTAWLALSCGWVILYSGLIHYSPGCRTASLYLDATFATEVSAAVANFAARLPKSFLFLPNACLSQKCPANVSFGTLLSFLFSITCSGLSLFRVARATPRSARRPLLSYWSKRRAKTPHVRSLYSTGTTCPVIHTGESLPAIASTLPVPEESSLQSKSPSPPA